MVVAYVFPKDSLIQPGEIAAQKLTRINYAFANFQDGRIVTGYANDDKNLAYSGCAEAAKPFPDCARLRGRMALVGRLLRHRLHQTKPRHLY